MSNKPEHSPYFKELIRKLRELKISADNGEIIVPNDDEDVLAFNDLDLQSILSILIKGKNF